jgi:integrase
MGKGKRAITAIDYFPAKARKDGRYQKKIKGKLHYFGGPGMSRDEAMAEYQRVRRALYDGREPAPAAGSMADVVVRDLMNLYLDERERDVGAGMITRANHVHSVHALKRFAAFVGADRPWAELSPADFSGYIRDLQVYGVFAFNQHIAHLNAFWQRCAANDWITAAPNRGPHWKKRKLPIRQSPDVVLSPAVVKSLVRRAEPTMRAMILFALNCGAGPTDCALLEWSDIDGDWCDSTRRKTDRPRRFPLWKITREALALLPRGGDQVFATAENQAWLPTSIAHAFRDLAGSLVPAGQGLRCCRYTFSTLADATLDINAKRLVMGHAPVGMDKHYVRLIGDVRLRAVTEYVRRALKVPGGLKGWV